MPAGQAAPLRHQGEAAILQLDRGDTVAPPLLSLNRGFEDDAEAADEPLVALMRRLGEAFPVVRATRFARVAE